MGKGPIIAGLIIVLVLAGGAFAITGKNKDDKTTNTTTNTSEQTSIPGKDSEGSSTGETKAAATITYDGSSFSPINVTVKSGDKVTVTNNSNKQLEFASDPHPVHTDDTDLNAGDEDPGKSKTFTVTKKGTFGFHNHYNAAQRGKIIVE